MNQFKEKLYAIVDIETTGSFAAAAAITEVAIYISDGTQILESFSSLVNPETAIPLGIQSLTGITQEMVDSAPRFSEIAEQVYNLLQGKIFVAHNVNFDFSFLRHQLLRAGYEWKTSKLCTVRLSRKILPGYPSYSLGKLCLSLGIPLRDRHRASGDAQATVKLFHLLLQRDDQQLIDRSLKQHSTEQRLPNHVATEDFEQLPHSPGIYLFKDRFGKIIYIGKAIDLKKRVSSHFVGNNIGLRRQQFLQEIYYIEFQEAGNELMALLMECRLIKQHWPKHNRALKRFEPKFGLIAYEDIKGFLRLAIIKTPKNTSCIRYFDRAFDANQWLLNSIEKYALHPFLCQFYVAKAEESIDRQQQLAALKELDIEAYNAKVQQALDAVMEEQESYIILQAGRDATEKNYIYVKDSRLYAIGFVSMEADIASPEDFILKGDYCSSNYYMMQLVEQYKLRHPQQVHYLAKQIM